MKISNFKYIITDVGGGWCAEHRLYGIKLDGGVYTTTEFKESELSTDTKLNDEKLEYLGKLNHITLGLRSKLSHSVMDASELTVYSVESTVVKIHEAPNIGYNNPVIYEEIRNLAAKYMRRRNKYNTQNKEPELVIGEIKESKEFGATLNKLHHYGNSVVTTHHALGDTDLVERLSKALKENKTWKSRRQ